MDLAKDESVVERGFGLGKIVRAVEISEGDRQRVSIGLNVLRDFDQSPKPLINRFVIGRSIARNETANPKASPPASIASIGSTARKG